MAKKATPKTKAKRKPAPKAAAAKSKAKLKAPPKPKTPPKPKRPPRPKAPPRAPRMERASSGPGAADAFSNLLQSPLVADLVAVAATAALAALAEHGLSNRPSSKSKGAGNAVKEAGKAAAAAVGRRLSREAEEIHAAVKAKKGG